MLFRSNAQASPDGLEEERRLMYVAITRARQRLYLSHAQTCLFYGQTRLHLPSRFLAELPDSALKWLTPKNRSGSFSGMSSHPGKFGKPASAPAASTAPARPASASGGAPIAVGMQVFHNKFGEGSVLEIQGEEGNAKTRIRFRRHSEKLLALAIAKLTPVD